MSLNPREVDELLANKAHLDSLSIDQLCELLPQYAVERIAVMRDMKYNEKPHFDFGADLATEHSTQLAMMSTGEFFNVRPRSKRRKLFKSSPQT